MTDALPFDKPRFRALLVEAAEGRAATECHPWPGNVTVYGYGRYSYGRAGQVLAHRGVVLLAGIVIPDGHEVDHTCHNADLTCTDGAACPHRRCVNLLHLDVVTPLTNWERGRAQSRANRRRTTCGPCGRPYDAVIRSHGRIVGRRCMTCTRISNARSAARRAERLRG